MSQGYLLLATGSAKYTDMARNAAASIRVKDRTRPICLVHDEAHVGHPDDARLFDHKHLLPADPDYPHVMNKIRLFDCSPFERTMFVDADCLLMKNDVQRWWDACASDHVSFVGRKRTSGEWKGFEIATVLQQEAAPYLVQINSGTFCFDSGDASRTFFAGLNGYYRDRRHVLRVGLHRGVPDQVDELYIALWLGFSGLDARKYNEGTETWSNSTWRGFGFRFDPLRDRSFFFKPTRNTFGIPNPLLGFEKLSPTFAHFVGLKPRAHYTRVAAWYRNQVASARQPDTGG